MHQYEWDTETGGLLLKPQQSKASNEPRPVYYREMNLLGMDKRWRYPQNDDAPIMFAEAERYIYRGRIVAKTRGGNLYAAPEVIYTEGVDGEPEGATLQAVDVATMVNKNAELMDHLVEETAKKIYSTYRHYQSKVDLFYVAFSGGKDSVVALDMVQRTLPHESFKVVFGDTQMEFPDTYDNVAKVEAWCTTNNIGFFRAKSKLKPQQTWACFGPPATDLRWCCSIHKTTPQILLLRHLTGKQNFTGMAFTGIRADESVARSQYEDVSEGKKHQGQYSCHVILDWNSAELYLHILRNNLPIGQSYYKGIPRAGCLVCPNAVGRSDYFRRKAYTAEIDAYLDVIRKTSAKNGIFSEEQMTDFIRNGNWRTRRTGRELNFGKDLFYYQQIDEGTHRYTIVKEGTKERLLSWFRTIGDTIVTSNESVQILLDGKLFEVKCGIDSDGYDCIEVSNCHKTKVPFFSLRCFPQPCDYIILEVMSVKWAFVLLASVRYPPYLFDPGNQAAFFRIAARFSWNSLISGNFPKNHSLWLSVDGRQRQTPHHLREDSG